MATLAVSPLQLHSRRSTDSLALVGFFVTFIVAVASVAYGVSNADYTKIVNVPSFCTNGQRRLEIEVVSAAAASAIVPGGRYLQSSSISSNAWVSLLSAKAAFLLLPAMLGLIVAVVWMAMLRTCATAIVYGTLIVKPMIFVALAGWLVSIGASIEGPAALIFVTIIYLLILMCMRGRIKLTAALLEQAVEVSKSHPGMYIASLFLLLLTIICAAAFLAGGYTLLLGDGYWMPSTTYGEGCAWTIPSTNKFLFCVVMFFALWAAELFFVIRFATVSLVTGIWYYEEGQDGGLPGGGSEDARAPLKMQARSAPVCTSLKLACTRSLGSLCLASLVLTICEILKSLARRSARNNGLLGLLVACCITCILNCIEFMTRFAVTYHALTGDPFCDSARHFASHCSRYGLAVVSVDVIAGIVLRFGAVVLSLFIAAVTTGVFYLEIRAEFDMLDSQSQVLVLLVPALCSWYLALLPLYFVGGVMLNIIDAAYSCLVLDLERRAGESRPELAYAVFSSMHASGRLKGANLVIQQPGTGGPVIAIATPVAGSGGEQQLYAQATYAQATAGYPQATPTYPQATAGYPQATAGYAQATPTYPQATAGYPQATAGYPQATADYASPTAVAQPVYGGATAVAQPVYGGATAVAQPVYGGAMAVAQPVYGGATAVAQPMGQQVAASQHNSYYPAPQV